jgi:TolB protein
MNADGTNRTRLTNNPADDSYPDWSPDGKKIAFMSNRVDPPSNKYEIYVMNAADGSGKTNISNNPGHDGTPSWSPDGEKIAFLCEREHNNEICIMNADGSEQTNMTNNNDNDAQPDWGTATGTEPSEGVR